MNIEKPCNLKRSFIRKAQCSSQSQQPPVSYEEVPEDIFASTVSHVYRLVETRPDWTPHEIVTEATQLAHADQCDHPFWQHCADSIDSVCLFGAFFNDLVDELTDYFK